MSIMARAKCEGYVYGKIEGKLGSTPIHRAIVNIIGPEVNYTATNEKGKYEFDIIAGEYKIYAEAEGYEPSEEKQFKVEDGDTHSESFLLEETPQKRFKDLRNRIGLYSGWVLWLATYAVFGVAILLAIASIFGFCIGTIDLFSGMLGGSENISANLTQQGGGETVYVNLIRGAEHYLIAFTLLIIGIGLHRIVSKGFQIELTGIEELESKMIGLVVVTLAVVFLSKLFDEKGTITWEVGFSVSLIIIALSVFMFILKRKVGE